MTDDFSNIKDVLPQITVGNLNSDYANIVSNWHNLVGKKFADKSEVAQIYSKGNNLYILVHVKSSPLVQELQFFKTNLIKKIKNEHGIDVSDIIIKATTKASANTETVKQTLVREIYSERPDIKELENINIEDKTINDLKVSLEKQKTLSQTQKQRMLEIIVNDLKTQEWMKQKGFPVCKKCGRVITQKNFGDKNICKFCQNNI